MALRTLTILLVTAALSFGSAIPSSLYDPRVTRDSPSCRNSDTSRSCWTAAYNISTDSDKSYPTTGVTVSYTLEVTNTTCNPDGSGERPCMLVNGQYPGPTLRAQWGDKVQVTVVNSMQHNGTSMHFHGVRQLNSPGSDGVNGISQCAIAPGDSATYTFQATQYGTSWYHSHTSVQYGDGVLGPIVFEGPATANYDVDLGPYVLNDYYGAQTAWQVGAISQQNLMSRQAPPIATNVLINGTARNGSGGGNYDVVRVQKGKKYRLRLINTSIATTLRVSLDKHSFLVIAADFVPVQPFTADWLLLTIGQRYDVVISADEAGGSYWFRANTPYECLAPSTRNGTAIWTYDKGAHVANPTSTANSGEPSDCQDESFKSFWPGSVTPSIFSDNLNVNLSDATMTSTDGDIVVWTLTDPIWTNYSDPTIGYLMRDDTDYPKHYNAISANEHGMWNYWLILNNFTTPAIPHPIHLHGHNSYVIGSGTGAFNPATANLNWQTPVRRDSQLIQAGGWLALAFKSDNPGAWLMHCHIAFHISEGLGMQYIESPQNATLPDAAQYARTCNNWNRYQGTELYRIDDSGL